MKRKSQKSKSSRNTGADIMEKFEEFLDDPHEENAQKRTMELNIQQDTYRDDDSDTTQKDRETKMSMQKKQQQSKSKVVPHVQIQQTQSTIENTGKIVGKDGQSGKMTIKITEQSQKIKAGPGSKKMSPSKSKQNMDIFAQDSIYTNQIAPTASMGDLLQGQRSLNLGLGGGAMQQAEMPNQNDQETEEDDKDPEIQARKGGLVSRTEQTYDDSDSNDSHFGGIADMEEGEINYQKTDVSTLKAMQLGFNKKVGQLKDQIEQEQKKRLLGDTFDSDLPQNELFSEYAMAFQRLTSSKQVLTLYPVVSCNITYNSKYVIVITKKSNHEFYIRLFSLATYEQVYSEKLGGDPTYQDPSINYIKVSDVEQDNSGTRYAFVFFNDGKFRLRTFDEDTINQKPSSAMIAKIGLDDDPENRKVRKRSAEEIEENELKINEKLKIDFNTMANDNFSFPNGTCCFISETQIFVNVFHTPKVTHHHFFFNPVTREISGQCAIKMDTNDKNFPQKSFYSNQKKEVYCFYRQGQQYRVPVSSDLLADKEGVKKLSNVLKNVAKDIIHKLYYFEKITDRALGQMFMVDEKILISRSSDQIILFRRQYDRVTKETRWINYFTLFISGQIFFIRGNVRFQVVTGDLIYFYIINFKTLMPRLENVMYNFMGCTQMLFGSKVRYCITFVQGQKSFSVYTRSNINSFYPTVVDKNFSASTGLVVKSMNAFLVSELANIKFYDLDAYIEFEACQITLPLLQNQAGQRKPNQVLKMTCSLDDEYLAVISGQSLERNMQQPKQIFVFKRARAFKNDEMDRFEQIHRVIVKDFFDKIKNTCDFYFKKPVSKGGKPNKLIFADKERIFEMNFETEKTYEIISYAYNPFMELPTNFLMNASQTSAIVCDVNQCSYYNLLNKKVTDLTIKFDIELIKAMYYDADEKSYYILHNRLKEVHGVYLWKFREHSQDESDYLLKVKNGLKIDDVSVTVIQDIQKGHKELVIAYKTIYLNTYTIKVFDLAEQLLMYNIVTPQMWESKIQGFPVHKTQDFVTVNSQGLNVINFYGAPKEFTTSAKQEVQVPAIEQVNFMKLNSKNMVDFNLAGKFHEISIVQQYTKVTSKGLENVFENLYKIKIGTTTLRELLLLQSMYFTDSGGEILRLVRLQPSPEIFLRTLMEFFGSNVVSILSFDSKSISVILDEKNSEHFQYEYPIFYKLQKVKKNNPRKFYFESAITTAIKNNQVRAVEMMIKYICKYQNNFVSFYLFRTRFHEMLDKGIEVANLLRSNIFSSQIDFDEWPSTHTDERTFYKSYNESFFDLRYKYDQLFPELEQDVQNEEEDSTSSKPQKKKKKLHKISYTVNFLPFIGEHIQLDKDGNSVTHNEDRSVMQMCIESGELDIFEVHCFQQFIQSSWNSYAFSFHFVNLLVHLYYVLCVMIYIYEMYIYDVDENKDMMITLLISGIVIPVIYELRQIYYMGLDYFLNFGTLSKLLYIIVSILNISLQETDPLLWETKLCMMLILVLQIPKTFNYLRLYPRFATIVSMLRDVSTDLMPFLLLFTIMFALVSQTFAVLGLGVTAKRKSKTRSLDESVSFEDGLSVDERIGGRFFAYITNALRYSLNNYTIDDSKSLSFNENIVFWLLWQFILIVAVIVMLNFVIAETSKSYAEVDERLEATIQVERAMLVSEAEAWIPKNMKPKQWFPQFVVIREIET